MEKYVFKVYARDGNIYQVKLKELENAELQAIDKFTIENGSFLDLHQVLANEIPIAAHEITRISILYVRKDIEFSIITGNKYLRNLLSEISGDQEITVSSQYNEMKNYLLEKLESDNYQDFFNNIYTYNNKFKSLLSRYATSYKQGAYSGEEMMNALTLRDEVEKKLKEYKNYRGLCICRQKNDDMYFSPISRTQKVNIQSEVFNPKGYTLNHNTSYTFKSLEERVADYNNDNEEFLSPEEFSEMNGELDDDFPKVY